MQIKIKTNLVNFPEHQNNIEEEGFLQNAIVFVELVFGFQFYILNNQRTIIHYRSTENIEKRLFEFLKIIQTECK
jgi:hypothetical protein